MLTLKSSLAILATLATCIAQSIPVSADASTGTAAPDSHGVFFHYVDGSAIGVADGASVWIDQARPVLGPAYHSLVELAVESLDTRQTVEVGWTVDKGLNRDYMPHLFVFHWVNGAPTCYNGCGFVQVDAAVHPGETVTPGDSEDYYIEHYEGNWWVGYKETWFGYFPDDLWNGAYTKAGLSQVFGEVATNGPDSCTMMGNGSFGTQPGSTAVSQFTLINPEFPVPALVSLVTDPLHYNQGTLTSSSFQLGGPGDC